MKLECTDFIETYTNELVTMLVDDFTPEAICVQLRLCDPQKPTKPDYLQPIELGGDIGKATIHILIKTKIRCSHPKPVQFTETNEISDSTFNGELITAITIDYKFTPGCFLCEKVVKVAEKHFVNKKSKAEIKEKLEHACSKMAILESECSAMVDKYSELIIQLLMAEFTPKQICRELGMCFLRMEVEMDPKDTHLSAKKAQELFVAVGDDDVKPFDGNTAYYHSGDSTACVLCQTVMTQLENELKDKTTQKEVEDAVKNICHSLPKVYDAQCSKFIDNYASLIISLIDTTPPKQICAQINLCAPKEINESKCKYLV